MSQLDGIFAPDLVDVAEKCKGQTVSMTKADLITIIADKLKFPWARAELLVDVVFGCLEQSMSRGERIEVRGFGGFTVRRYCSVHDGPIFAFTMVRDSQPRRCSLTPSHKERDRQASPQQDAGQNPPSRFVLCRGKDLNERDDRQRCGQHDDENPDDIWVQHMSWPSDSRRNADGQER